jgi:hypothetical protein
MDPYLEGPLWTTVHTSLINEIAHQLAPLLRPKYLALPQERVVVTVPDPVEIQARSRFPGVGVYTSEAAQPQGSGAVTTAPLMLDALLPASVPDCYLEIRDVGERRLVTAIEVLSPSIYDWYGYDRAADHAGEPPLPLAPEQQAWADERLRAAGLRA